MRVRRWLLSAIGALIALGVAGFFAFQAGYIRLTNPDPSRYPIEGLDVSRHQGEIDWSVVASAGGQEFAYIKATEGRDHTDSMFEDNWLGAKEAGLARGAYHFFTFCTSGQAQAEHFLATTGRPTGELPPAVDVEFKGNCTRWESIRAIRAELLTFLRTVEEADHRRPVIYTTDDAYDRLLDGHLRRPRLWIRTGVRFARGPAMAMARVIVDTFLSAHRGQEPDAAAA